MQNFRALYQNSLIKITIKNRIFENMFFVQTSIILYKFKSLELEVFERRHLKADDRHQRLTKDAFINIDSYIDTVFNCKYMRFYSYERIL